MLILVADVNNMLTVNIFATEGEKNSGATRINAQLH